MGLFEQEYPSLESYWRAVILFGRNVASYKLSLAKSLLELMPQGKDSLSLEDIALPFSRHICEHIKNVDKQATSQSSKFLQACKNFNDGTLKQGQLIEITAKIGFNNVLDAFHVVNNGEIPVKFFEVTGTGTQRKLTLADEIFKLGESVQFSNFSNETEARWRLVETAWSLRMPSNMLKVNYDNDMGLFYVTDEFRRINVTYARDALNGYQKGKCFYCFDDISVDTDSDLLGDVDHFFPHTLQPILKPNLDGIWNLVLTCKSCNRGTDGKFAKVPETKYLERLHKRNSYFIDSHHPLRETLINQTGADELTRRRFLQDIDKYAINALIHRWKPTYEYDPVF